MSSTKQRIVHVSLQLFNQHGIDAVRLQQIAEETGISVGNLAYHFKNKEAIIEAVYERLLSDFSDILRMYAVSASLANFDEQLTNYFHFFNSYQFYVADFFKANTTPTNHQQVWQENTHKMLIQVQGRIDLLVLNHVFIKEPFPNIYRHLAENTWLNIIFYLQKCRMLGMKCTRVQYKTAIWKQMQPFFTETGLREFNMAILPTLAY
jgi:AcrR family transcriptional regulator